MIYYNHITALVCTTVSILNLNSFLKNSKNYNTSFLRRTLRERGKIEIACEGEEWNYIDGTRFNLKICCMFFVGPKKTFNLIGIFDVPL